MQVLRRGAEQVEGGLATHHGMQARRRKGSSASTIPIVGADDGRAVFRGAGAGAEGPTKFSAKTKGNQAKATQKDRKAGAAAGGRPASKLEEDELFVLEDAVSRSLSRGGVGDVPLAEFLGGAQRSLSEARANKLFRATDADRDGVLSWDEYLVAVSPGGFVSRG